MSDQFDPYYVWLGIPPEESAGGGPNHYRLLGLRPFEANADVISNAVDQRRTFLRTMQSGKRGVQSQQLLNEVSAAGVCLLNAEKKARYDEELRRKLTPAPAASPPSPPPLAAPIAGAPRPTSPQSQPAAVASQSATIISVKPRRKSKAPSTAAIAGLIVSCAAALGIIGAGVAWWLLNGRSASGPIATASRDASPQSSVPETTATPIEPEKVSPSPGATEAIPQPAVIEKPAAVAPPPAPPASNPPAPPVTSATSSSPAPVQPPPQPQSSPDVAPLPTVRPLPPTGELLASAMEQARKIYEGDFKTASKTPQKAVLAHKILETGKGTQSDPTARYVLIDLARKVFVQAGEVDDALAAARLLESEYEVSREELVTVTLEALESVQLAPEQRTELAKISADLAEVVAGAEEFERADKLAALALAAARKQRDGDLQKEIAQRRAQVGDLLKDWNAVKASLEKLKADHGDAEANLAAGKFYCFTLEDYQRGLPFLSAGGDSLLAEAARLDIAARNEGPAKRLEAATAWQQAGAKVKAKDDKQAVQRREKWLLTQAVSNLTGLDQIKAQKRLDELKDVGQGRAGSVAGTSPRTAIPRRNVAMMGRLLSGNKDAGIVVTYDHGYVITEDDFARMLSAANITNPQNLKLGLVGGFLLQSEHTVSLHRSGRSGVGGSHRIWVDSRPYNIGPNNSYNVSDNIRLNAGLHVVRWELAGDNLGTAQLEIRLEATTNGGSTALLPMTVDRTVEQAAHQLPSKATVHFGSK